MKMDFSKDICSNLEIAVKREWLETNGLGGFASSTVAGLNTRRYHGLLVAATKPPVGRLVLLSKFEEALLIHGQRFELSANQYPGAIHPQGYQYLKRFRLDPFPIFTYEVNGAEIEKSVFMIHGKNSTVIQYELKSAADVQVQLEVRPLIAFRDYHSTTHENGSLNGTVRTESGLASVAPYRDLPVLYFAHTGGQLETVRYWYRNFEYEVERERGLDFHEDLYSPFALKFDLTAEQPAAIIASTELCDVQDVADYRAQEIGRRKAVVALSPFAGKDDLTDALIAAADAYIVSRGDQKSVIAGYHWFGDWGRDTMIALPGLTLYTGRPDVAKSILLAFATYVDRGMLPNRFPDAGEVPEYNTVDATLWFFEAVRALLQHTNDYEFIRTNLYEALTDIIGWHDRGTRYGIRVGKDGLLRSGEPGVQLTWMDAKVGDWVVTPRQGKAVEIQALWYNALRIMEQLAGRLGDEAGKAQYAEMASKAYESFQASFWNEEAGCLYDVVDGEHRDGSIRPNQVFAISLPNALLSGARAKRVLKVVQRELLTPVGLRSLAPSDPQYRPRYEGGPSNRDSAYHQGTVWPWLMGPFLTAYVKTYGKTARKKAQQLLEPFRDHLQDAGLGHVSEVFDADPPQRPAGCMAQAWSVAELLRAALEDVL